jgi:hypothetical protein
MAKRKPGTKKSTQAGNGQSSGIVTLTKELFQAAIAVRGLHRGAQVSRTGATGVYVLPIMFVRFPVAAVK